MKFAERLREKRRQVGLTQAAVATALEVTQPTVTRWEAGVSLPDLAQIAQLAELLTCNPGWLAFGEQGEDEMTTGPDNTIAFQGFPGAYSHLACRHAFPSMEVLPCPSFEDAFAAVEDGKARLAMIPIENSLGGRVADIHHLLPRSSLFIIGEHFEQVEHHLLAPKGAKLEGLKIIRSHPQGLAQCRELIRGLKVQAEAHSDTAGAARDVAEAGDLTVGALASSLAAEIYGLDILRSRVEDKIGNTTRFVIMARNRKEPDPRSGPCLTSFVFEVRSVPAALYKALGGFATNGVNIVKLESYIVDASFTVAQFYAEIEGHPADKSVDFALDELGYFSNKLKLLGTYPQNAFRKRS